MPNQSQNDKIALKTEKSDTHTQSVVAGHRKSATEGERYKRRAAAKYERKKKNKRNIKITKKKKRHAENQLNVNLVYMNIN